MKWINALGMLLQFISFWMAAPELLGESNLKRFEKGLRNTLTLFPIVLLGLLIATYGILFLIRGIYLGIKGGFQGIESSEMHSFYWAIGISTFLYIMLILYFKRIRQFLERNISIPLTRKLLEDQQLRKSSLIMAAILLSIGFMMQFLVLILS